MQNREESSLKIKYYKIKILNLKQYCHFPLYAVHCMYSTFQQSYILCSEC